MSTPTSTPNTSAHPVGQAPATHTPASLPQATPRISDSALTGRSNSGPTSEALKHAEGPVARAIEDQTAKLPSDLFLWAGLGALGLSVALKAMARKDDSLFVGQFTAPLLVMGLYDKLVKVQGSDRVHTS